MSKCRCGRDLPVHLCHHGGYTCPREGSPRLVATNGAVSGTHLKVSAYQTWACDEHWAEFAN